MSEVRNSYFSKEVAQKMIDAVEQQAYASGQSLAISIVDTAGEFSYYRCMDGLDSSVVKQASRQALRMAGREQAQYVYGARTVGQKTMTLAHAIIAKDGSRLGGIGISGASEDVARRCVNAALEVFPAHL